MIIKYTKTNNFISEPIRYYETDAGADVFASYGYIIKPRERYAMSLGFCLEVPINHMAIISTKSSTFLKGLICHTPPIDCGYTGEVHALLENITNQDIVIEKGQKVGQLIILPIITPTFIEASQLDKTLRGNSGFGSTEKA